MSKNDHVCNYLGMTIMLPGSKFWDVLNDKFLIHLLLSSEQVYNSVATSFPRRFVLPLRVSLNAPEGENLSPLSYSSASAVKQADGKVGSEQILDEDIGC